MNMMLGVVMRALSGWFRQRASAPQQNDARQANLDERHRQCLRHLRQTNWDVAPDTGFSFRLVGSHRLLYAGFDFRVGDCCEVLV